MYTYTGKLYFFARSTYKINMYNSVYTKELFIDTYWSPKYVCTKRICINALKIFFSPCQNFPFFIIRNIFTEFKFWETLETCCPCVLIVHCQTPLSNLFYIIIFNDDLSGRVLHAFNPSHYFGIVTAKYNTNYFYCASVIGQMWRLLVFLFTIYTTYIITT